MDFEIDKAFIMFIPGGQHNRYVCNVPISPHLSMPYFLWCCLLGNWEENKVSTTKFNHVLGIVLWFLGTKAKMQWIF